MTSNNWSFIEHATNHLLRPRLGDSKAPTLWPSQSTALIVNDYNEEEVVGACRRSTWFRYMTDWHKYDPSTYSIYDQLAEEVKVKSIPPDKYMLWIWRAGELYEDYLINIAKESGVYIGGQIQVYIPEYNISGKIDILTINPRTHKYSIVEAKSVYGHGGNAVLGTQGQRSKGQLGEPRSGNLMQTAIYDWWMASKDEQYEDSRLVYGGRDTGRYAEYLVSTKENQENKETNIYYKGIAPNETTKIKSKITINSILQQAKYIHQSVEGGHMPQRDYDLKYDEETIDKMYERDELGKTDKERYEKRKEWLAGKRKRETKALVKGAWQCNYCKYKNVCYKSTNPKSDDYGEPREL